MYRWYQQFEAQHFPDPAGLRESIAKYTLHLYPGILKAAMAVFDVPEAIAVTRTAMCSGSMSSLTRLQVSMRPHSSHVSHIPCVWLIQVAGDFLTCAGAGSDLHLLLSPHFQSA